MKVLLVEELAGRERLPLLAIKAELERRGDAVQISNSWQMERAYRDFEPDVIADNISDSVAHYVGKIPAAPKHARNVNLIWEQLPNPLNLRRYRFDTVLQRGLVDGRVAWGDRFRDILLFQNPEMDADRVRTTGSIKHGLHHLYAGIARQELATFYGINVEGYDRVVLFADSFQAASMELDGLLDHRITHNRHSPYAYEFALWARAVQEEAMRLLLGLAKDNPETLFIVRMHPTKNETYRNQHRMLSEHSNIVVNMTGEFTGLLQISDLLIAARSGALVDAHFMGRPAINVRPPRSPLDATRVTWAPQDQFGYRIGADDGLEAGLEELIMAAAIPNGSHGDPEQWFGPRDGRCYARVADFIQEIAAAPQLARRVPMSRMVFRRESPKHPFKRRVRHQIRAWTRRVGNPPDDDFPYAILFDRLTGNRSAFQELEGN